MARKSENRSDIASVSTSKVKKSKSSPKLDLKRLTKVLGKKFPEPIKTVLQKDIVYQILKAKLDNSGRFGVVLLIDVAAGFEGKRISTYFAALHTKEVVAKVELQGIDLHKTPEALIGLTFIYRGEVKSKAGHHYSNIEFCTDESGDSSSDDSD